MDKNCPYKRDIICNWIIMFKYIIKYGMNMSKKYINMKFPEVTGLKKKK